MSATDVSAPADPVAPALDLEADLTRRITIFEDAARRVREGNDDEAIHDFRVASRRLLAMLIVWQELFEPNAYARARRRVRSLRRALGPARETEVHVEFLQERLPKRPVATRQAAEKVLAWLERRRARRRQAAARQVRKRTVTGIVTVLNEAAHDLAVNALARPAALEAARDQVERRSWQAQEALDEAVRLGSDEALHGARIAVKKWRYAGECLSVTSEAGKSLDRLRELQEILGEIHDRAALLEVLRRPGGRRGESNGELEPLVKRIERERRVLTGRFRGLARSTAGESPGRRTRRSHARRPA